MINVREWQRGQLIIASDTAGGSSLRAFEWWCSPGLDAAVGIEGKVHPAKGTVA